MDFYEVVNKRRSIRQFEDREIPRDVLERILDAGLKAPSSDHQRRWELVVLTDKERIQEFAAPIRPYPYRPSGAKTPQQDMFRISFPLQHSMVADAAAVVLPYFRQKYPLDNSKNEYGLWDYAATWALIENMLLAATAEGLGSGVHLPGKKERAAFEEIIKPKSGYFLASVVVLGHAAADAEVPRQVEATVAKKVHWNMW